MVLNYFILRIAFYFNNFLIFSLAFERSLGIAYPLHKQCDCKSLLYVASNAVAIKCTFNGNIFYSPTSF